MNAVENGPLQGLMTALGRRCVRRPWLVVAGWALLVVTVAALVVGFGRPTEDDTSVPGSDGQYGRDLLERHVPTSTNAAGQVIVRAGSGRLDEPANAEAVAAAADRMAAVRHVVDVALPAAERGSLSADGRIGYLTVTFDLGPREVGHPLADEVLAAAGPPAREAGLTIAASGVLARPDSETRTSELLGLGVAALVLTVVFGGLIAAGLPLVTALVTLVSGLGLIGLGGHLTDVPSVATTLATMIGLGVGIDYALFLVTRYRALLAAGHDHGEAVVATLASSGSAVVFAGGTVVVALGGLAVTGVPILTTLGWTAGLVVLLAVATAVTLLPALLALLGSRIDALRVLPRRLVRIPAAANGGGGRANDVTSHRASGSGWGRLAERVTRRPWPYAIGTLVVLAALAAPAADLRLGFVDPGNQTPGTAARVGYDLLAEGFGPGVNGPLTVVAELNPPAAGPDDPRLAELATALGRVPGVNRRQPPQLSPDGVLAMVRVEPTTGPGDPATEETAEALRQVPVSGMEVHVTGQATVRAALADRVAERMPYVIALVVALSAVLLLFAFRAPVIAVKAAAMNLVSIGAAYGALNAVFGWGWGVELTGLDGPVPIEAYLPVMLFALLFGLSMDYEVFLLTAIAESWHATGDNRRAVRDGLAGTGRVITSAALIMICVFSSFVLHTNPVVKMFGLGMSVAIAVDATIVRGLLVPATMALLGRANWWTPGRRRGAGGADRREPAMAGRPGGPA